MARRPKHVQPLDHVSDFLERHMQELGFSSTNTYIDWCWANGFDGSLQKSKIDIIEELDFFHAKQREREAQSRLHHNPKNFLEAICKGDLSSDDIDRPIFKMVAAEVEASNEAETSRLSLLEMLVALLKYDSLIFDTATNSNNAPFIRGLIKLHDRKPL